MTLTTTNPRPTQTHGAFKSYGTANGVLGFIEVVSWIIVVVGALLLMITGGIIGESLSKERSISASDLLALVGLLPGILVTLAGLVLVALVQSGRATIHTAQMTGEMLRISRQQLQLSRQ